jgi:hypothetical protein
MRIFVRRGRITRHGSVFYEATQCAIPADNVTAGGDFTVKTPANR